MGQRVKSKGRKSRERTPRRVASRISKGRKRVSERRRSGNKARRPDYVDRHGVSLNMPSPERWRFRHPSPDDFVAVANEVAGRDLGPFFDQVYRGSEAFDYEVSSVTSFPVEVEG